MGGREEKKEGSRGGGLGWMERGSGGRDKRWRIGEGGGMKAKHSEEGPLTSSCREWYWVTSR